MNKHHGNPNSQGNNFQKTSQPPLHGQAPW
jgi:hypothetical protein